MRFGHDAFGDDQLFFEHGYRQRAVLELLDLPGVVLGGRLTMCCRLLHLAVNYPRHWLPVDPCTDAHSASFPLLAAYAQPFVVAYEW